MLSHPGVALMDDLLAEAFEQRHDGLNRFGGAPDHDGESGIPCADISPGNRRVDGKRPSCLRSDGDFLCQ